MKVEKYMDLLDRWGARMALTSIHDREEVVRFHFGESIFALSAADIGDGRLADVGSGAGFPGLALKLAVPSLPLTLIEPNKRKCAFLHEIVRSLELTDVRIIAARFESSPIERHSLRSIACRALGKPELLLDWASEKLMIGGSVLLWIGTTEAEALLNERTWNWDRPTLIPGTRERFLLRGRRAS